MMSSLASESFHGLRAIAFHLPQFHPIPENDEWWGKGFTEWTNVVRARPLFQGHYQPHLPADLGFYDLRLSETREAQAELAKNHGISGFCYYHYWFQGRRLLGRPIDDILRMGRPDFPFCLCWANESWTRGWLGEERNLLISQTYDPHDDLRHCHWLANAFADPRYLRMKGRAIFLIYRPGHLPEPRRLTDMLRDVCIKNGDENPYLIGVDAHHPGRDFRSDGFDTTLVFEPQLSVLPAAFYDEFSRGRVLRNLRLGLISGRLKVYDYTDARDRILALARPFATVPCVLVSWDNTARRGENGVIIVNSSPQTFGRALETTVSKLRANGGEPLLFINAWNEWAEGNHLEPCQKWGRGYLEATRKVLGTFANRNLEYASHQSNLGRT
jgi:lipopolysaccharide biosynthesis protein